MNKHDEYCLKYQGLHDGTAGFRVVGANSVFVDKKQRLFDGSNFFEKLYEPFTQFVDKKGGSVRVLDFGCGKAIHLFKRVLDGKTLHEAFPGKIQSYYCYDPGYAVYSTPPAKKEKFDVIICADVMEHIPEESVHNVLKQLDEWAEDDGFILLSISGKPAMKMFADGENLHCNIKDAAWWKEILDASLTVPYLCVHTGEDGEVRF